MLSFKGMKNGLDVLYIGDKGEIGGELKGVPDGEVPDNLKVVVREAVGDDLCVSNSDTTGELNLRGDLDLVVGIHLPSR